MKHCLRKVTNIIAALSVVAAAAITGCTREGDSTLGYEFLPKDQRLETRHKSFKDGVVRSYDARKGEYVDSPGHRMFKTTHYRTDSLVSSNLQSGYFGIQRDLEGIFGMREAGFASEYIFAAVLDDDGFGYLPIFDSITLDLSVFDHSGDTLRPIRYEVYEITGNSLTQSMTDIHDGDTIAYINHDMSELYDPSKPIFTFTFPDPDREVYPSSASVTMQPVDLSANGSTWQFVKRLMLVGDLDNGWDGYATDDDELYKSFTTWVENFRGIYIKPAEELPAGDEGSMYAADLSASQMHLYGRNRKPEEPRLVQDTIEMSYLFYHSDAAAGNTSINTIRHDYSGSKLQDLDNIDDRKRTDSDDLFEWREENRRNHTESAEVYVEGLGGAVTELYFTDDFLRELHNLSTEEEFSHTSINQALMYVYLQGSDYDWSNVTPEITPLLDSSLTRLGTYTSMESLSPISDYNYYYEANYGTSLNYDGYLKRSLGCYVMDISSYMQRLKNYVDKLCEEEGFDWTSDSFEFKADDDASVSRTLYLAPEAYSLYALQRSRLQGMEDALNNASIRIELTYTMIK